MVDFVFPTNLKENILAVLAYTDIFGYPLTKEEIWKRLLQIHSQKKSSISFHSFIQELNQLVIKKNIGHEEKFFFLPGRNGIVKQRIQKEKISRVRMSQANQFVQLVRWIPWVKSIWITGSLAMMNAKEHQDVDFMIVTQARRLWLSRVLIGGITWIVGKKRAPKGNEQRTWCLNLWLDEDHLLMSEDRQNVYTAYEVTQAKNIFDRDNSAQVFWFSNRWVKSFLPNWEAEKNMPTKIKGRSFFSLWIDILEHMSYQLQMMYMKRHRTTEHVGQGYAFFHPRQTSFLVTKQWQERRNKLQSSI